MFNPERPPEIIAQRWLNSDKKRTLKAEKGKVIVIAIWQLECPGSQKFGLPQAMRLRRAFALVRVECGQQLLGLGYRALAGEVTADVHGRSSVDQSLLLRERRWVRTRR